MIKVALLLLKLFKVMIVNYSPCQNISVHSIRKYKKMIVVINEIQGGCFWRWVTS